jgi:hypothetical protein
MPSGWQRSVHQGQLFEENLFMKLSDAGRTFIESGVHAYSVKAPEPFSSQALSRIYWLSGSPCGGKTTIANLLAERFDWDIYHCDDYFGEHRERSTPQDHPTFFHLSRLRGDALWLRPVPEQIRTEIQFCADQFKMVVTDLQIRLEANERPIIFEGAAALPHLLAPLLESPHHAFWLIPTESFQLHHYPQRPWIHEVLAETSEPERAFANWMARDVGFARWLEGQVAEYDMPWLSVDGSLTIEETAEHIARWYVGT